MSDLPQIPRDREGGILKRQPLNTNPAFSSNFRLVIPKVRSGVYFCTEVTFPDMTCDAVKLPVPMAPSIKFFGNKVAHGDLSVKFVINEDYSNYNQMSDWFKSTLVFGDFFTGNTSRDNNIISNQGHLLILSNYLSYVLFSELFVIHSAIYLYYKHYLWFVNGYFLF